MSDRYYKQELIRRLQFYLEFLKEQDAGNPVANGRGVKLISEVLDYICKN